MKAMVLALVVGIPVSALAQDAVTGFVAGMGAGGVVALRPEVYNGWKGRALGVIVASVGIDLFVRVAGVPAILSHAGRSVHDARRDRPFGRAATGARSERG